MMNHLGEPSLDTPTVNVFVTGQPGIGKTSLVLGVAKKLPPHLIAGFYTVEAKAEGTGEKLGLDVVTLSGQRAPLCRLRRGCGPKIGKYYVAIDEFERVVLPQLIPNDQIKLHIIDEVGRMELCSKKFTDAVMSLLSSPQAVFGSLPAPRYGHTLELVEQIKQRPDTAVLTLTKSNRNAIAFQVEDLLTKLLDDDMSQFNVNNKADDLSHSHGTGGGHVEETFSSGSNNAHFPSTFGVEPALLSRPYMNFLAPNHMAYSQSSFSNSPSSYDASFGACNSYYGGSH